MKNICILGSTGSIGVSALDVIVGNPSGFKILALSAGKNLKLLKNQVQDRKVNVAVVHADDPGTAELLKERISRILNCAEVVVTDLSLAVAANLGPGTVGIVACPVDA